MNFGADELLAPGMQAAGAAISIAGAGVARLGGFDVDTDDSDDTVVDRGGGNWSLGDGGSSTLAGSILDAGAEGTSLER